MANDQALAYCQAGISRGLAKHYNVESDLPQHLREQLLRLRLAESQDHESGQDSSLNDRMARRELNSYIDKLSTYLPGWFCRGVIWLRKPERRIARIVASLFLVMGGFLAFLPLLGFWMLPLGLIVIAQDLPFLQQPLVRMFKWTDRQIQKLRTRFPLLSGRRS